MSQRGVRMPGGQNPAAKVERQREPAPEIRFLTKGQIAQQLDALSDRPVLQAMVAVYVYAGTSLPSLEALTTDRLSSILSPQLWAAFLLLAIFPLVARQLVRRLRRS